ncbi:hypothetical protein PSN45_004916 [Yamadazyma tenuis]|nr:hypothetical protein PSN45_004916 [Yamadazyma tenuis]
MSRLQSNRIVEDSLNNISRQLNSLLSDLKKKSSSASEPSTHTKFISSESRERMAVFEDMNEDMDEEFENVEGSDNDTRTGYSEEGEPLEQIGQLSGYLNSTASFDQKHEFNDILRSAYDLVQTLPDNGRGNRPLNEFIASLEPCIGSFTT